MNISDFNLFFMWKLQPPEKNSPPLSQQTSSKSWGPVKPPVFENLFGGSTPPPPPPHQKGGGCTLCKGNSVVTANKNIYTKRMENLLIRRSWKSYCKNDAFLNLVVNQGKGTGFDNWHTYDFGHAYVETYAHFFLWFLKSFQNFSGSLKTYCYIFHL